MMTKFNIDKFGVAEIITKKWITKLPIITLQYMLALIHSTKYLEKEKKKKIFCFIQNYKCTYPQDDPKCLNPQKLQFQLTIRK